MWNFVKNLALNFILPAAVATAAHAISRLVIDDLADERKAARSLRYAQLRKASARKAKPAARGRRSSAK